MKKDPLKKNSSMKKDQLSLSLLLSQTNQSILQLQVLTTCSFTTKASKSVKSALAHVLAVAGLLLSFDLFAADENWFLELLLGPVVEPQVEAPVAAADPDPDPVADPADQEMSDPELGSGEDIPSDGDSYSSQEDGGVLFEEAPLEGEKKGLLIQLLKKTNWGLETPEGQRALAHNLVSGKDLNQSCMSITRYHRFLVKLLEQAHQIDQSSPEIFWENHTQGKELTDQRRLVKGALDNMDGKQIIQVLMELAPGHPGLRELELDGFWLAAEPLNNTQLLSQLENQIWMWHIYIEGPVKEAILSHESLEGFIASEASEASEDTPIEARERVSTFFPVTPEESSTPTHEESSTPVATKTVTNSSVRKTVTNSSVRKELFTPLKPLKPPEPPGSSSKGS